MTDTELLWEAICRSGLSVAGFARDTLVRSPSTVRRWLRGETPIPKEVRTYLHKRRAWLEGAPVRQGWADRPRKPHQSA